MRSIYFGRPYRSEYLTISSFGTNALIGLLSHLIET